MGFILTIHNLKLVLVSPQRQTRISSGRRIIILQQVQKVRQCNSDELRYNITKSLTVYIADLHEIEYCVHGTGLFRCRISDGIDSKAAEWFLILAIRCLSCFGVNDISADRITGSVKPVTRGKAGYTEALSLFTFYFMWTARCLAHVEFSFFCLPSS